MRVVEPDIRKLFVLILALFRLIRGFSVLSIWGVLVFLSILRLLLVSRFGCPYAVVSVGQFDLEALRVARC